VRDRSRLAFAIGAIVRPETARIGEAGPEPRSRPNEPTVYTLSHALFAQFARIRSVTVKTCDYGSGGRGFESLPARNTEPAFYTPLEGRILHFRVRVSEAVHRVGVTDRDKWRAVRSVSIDACGWRRRWAWTFSRPGATGHG
jgi:hypothetical protein